NASELPMRVTITAEGMPELDVQGGRGESTTLELPPAANRLLPVRVRRPADDAAPGSHKIRFVIHADSGSASLVLREPSSFIVPR
ncbi:FixG Ig-like domain-containing protein, partial [Salmonella enterica subsp. enterica serovar Typhimurium]